MEKELIVLFSDRAVSAYPAAGTFLGPNGWVKRRASWMTSKAKQGKGMDTITAEPQGRCEGSHNKLNSEQRLPCA
jgi:hypothetical protein